MTPIRPPAITDSPAVQRDDPARGAAQRAFFEAALGRTPTPNPMVPAQAPMVPAQAKAVAAAAVQRFPDPEAPAPTRILRPGSLLDIKV